MTSAKITQIVKALGFLLGWWIAHTVLTLWLVEGGLREWRHLRKELRVLRHPKLLSWLVRHSHQYHRHYWLLNF